MEKFRGIKEKILKEILPSSRERKLALKKFEEIRKYIESNFGIEADLMGSVAKNTFLKGNKDLDIFLLFEKEMERNEMEKKALDIGKRVFEHFKGSYEIDYAEHPYVKGKIGNYKVEIVPCYKLNSIGEMRSSVDRTPFHKKWVLENLNDEMRKDVVLLKQFLKVDNLYGSSLKIKGFSGYLCEVLIAYYKSFWNLIVKGKEWKTGELIDVENHHNGILPEDLRIKFKNQPLIVIDPVDKNRNVSAVLSIGNFRRFVEKCREFYRNPDEIFFKKKEIQIDENFIKKEIERRKIYYVEIEKPKIIDDILFPQLEKAERKIGDFMRRNDFYVIKSGIFEGRRKVRIVFEFEEDFLKTMKRIVGPPLREKKHVEKFKKKYKNFGIEGNRVVAYVDRDCKDVRKCYEILKLRMENSGIPKNLQSYFINGKMMKAGIAGKEWKKFLMRFLRG